MPTKAKVIGAKKDLQMKVGTGKIDEQKVVKAQKVIEETEVDFHEIAAPVLSDLSQIIKKARSLNGEISADKMLAKEMAEPIMNMKANASTFKYPLISKMSNTVLMLIEDAGQITHEMLDITDNLHKAVSIAVTQKLRSEKHPVGAELLKEFESVCQRYRAKRL